ncbi:type VI secretion system-associated FHA domain protein TagH [Aliikangiella marina]|uniref:Type VI secretion system-associated FHA domain protein TagH n=1 Tax=Aliikangiella marina TaxID=1712262 RepID=A0A545TGT1_9GAMM|nr:type VI secretion system-associated FHA domain protein TagH [Aliikangiella marina]TQV76415.1 type VI secretion system-associated FHA domain protein TagH [Aliikangiella marina]
MSIVVSILEYPEGVELAQSSMTFSDQGGTLGRGQDNTWVLSDPERFLSGCHSQIVFENGNYYLIDTSTNGTYVNNSGEPLGKGNKVQLKDGDLFELSDYKFQVNITAAAASAADPNLGFSSAPPSNIDIDDPFGAPPMPAAAEPAPIAADPFAASFGSSQPSTDLPFNTELEETDPLAALDKSRDSLTSEPTPETFASSYSDNAAATGQAVSFPSPEPSHGLIPEDWDDDLLEDPAPVAPVPNVAQSPVPIPAEPTPVEPVPAAPVSVPPQPADAKPTAEPLAAETPATVSSDAEAISVSESEARRKALEQAYKKLKAENAKLKKHAQALKKRSSSGVDSSIVDGFGFAEKNLDNDKIAEINEVSGKFIRLVVEGMMQTLASRNNIKNTFRMNMTTIQPVENNPLKFSANVDDALENMFLREGNSYKKPLESAQESFESIADHQVAILAGIRSAFKSIVERFEPAVLEARFEKQQKRSLIPLNEKAKYWDAYSEYYAELFEDLDKSFQYVFGDEFSMAYEEQLQKLSMARKTKN